MNVIIFIENVETNEYFFTSKHSQQGLSNDWVPVTIYIPHQVEKRASLPDGIVKNKDDVKKVYLSKSKEIKNPDSELQA